MVAVISMFVPLGDRNVYSKFNAYLFRSCLTGKKVLGMVFTPHTVQIFSKHTLTTNSEIDTSVKGLRWSPRELDVAIAVV